MVWVLLLFYYEVFLVAVFYSIIWSNFSGLLKDQEIYESVLNSLKVGVFVAVVLVLLSAMVVWVVTWMNIWFWLLLEYVSIVFFVFLGVVLGVALLQVYLVLLILVYGTIWVLVIAFCVKYLFYGMRFVFFVLLQIGCEHEEVASMSGVGWFWIFFKIVFLLMAALLIGVFMYIFLLSMKELLVAFLLYIFGTQLVSVQIYTLWTQGQISQLAVFGVFIIVVLLVVVLAFWLLIV